MKGLITAAAAVAMASAPVAFAADTSRVSAPTAGESSFAGASALPLILLIAILAAGVWLVVDDDEDDSESP